MPLRPHDMCYEIFHPYPINLYDVVRFDFPLRRRSYINISAEQINTDVVLLINDIKSSLYVHDNGLTEYLLGAVDRFEGGKEPYHRVKYLVRMVIDESGNIVHPPTLRFDRRDLRENMKWVDIMAIKMKKSIYGIF